MSAITGKKCGSWSGWGLQKKKKEEAAKQQLMHEREMELENDVANCTRSIRARWKARIRTYAHRRRGKLDR